MNKQGIIWNGRTEKTTLSLFAIILAAVSLYSGCSQPEPVEKEIRFASGRFSLPGTLCLPGGKNNGRAQRWPVCLLVSGEGFKDRDATIGSGSAAARPFAKLATALAKRGIASLRFDSRAFLTRKTNRLSNPASPGQMFQDVRAACSFLKENRSILFEHISLVGHGLAGSILLDRANALPIQNLILVSPVVLALDQQILFRLKYQIDYYQRSSIRGRQALIRKTRTMLQEYIKAFARLPQIEDESQRVLGFTAGYWHRMIAATSNFPQKIQDCSLPLVIIQGERDLFNPASLLKQAMSQVKTHKRPKILYIKGMTHGLYDYMTRVFEPASAEHISRVARAGNSSKKGSADEN